MVNVTKEDLTVRSTNDEADIIAGNTFATFDEVVDVLKFRHDGANWSNADEDEQVKSMVQAYFDVIRLNWDTSSGRNQAKDYEFQILFGAGSFPPMDDDEFMRAVKRAQAIQALYIINGTQVRDMSREGIRITKSLSGSEMEIRGYTGPVCTEAKEIISRWVNHQPRLKRMA